jgi:hypothetical protein
VPELAERAITRDGEKGVGIGPMVARQIGVEHGQPRSGFFTMADLIPGSLENRKNAHPGAVKNRHARLIGNPASFELIHPYTIKTIFSRDDHRNASS